MSSEARIAVFADFDDTLTTQNVAHFLLKKFAPRALELYSSQYRAGEISFREYQENAFDAVKASVNEMQNAAANEVELRHGIHELLEAIGKADGVFTVASAGLHFYIDPVLKRHGLEELNVVCGTAVRSGSDNGEFGYDYPFPIPDLDQPTGTDNDQCRGDWATCKCKALEQAGQSAVTIFVGDGSTSDACVAEKADHVFARDRLLRICNEKGLRATPFEDFSPVTELVKRLSTEAKNHLLEIAGERPEQQ